MSGITVDGHGEARGIPDIFTLSTGVSVMRSSVAEATAAANEAAAQVTAALTSRGVAEDDLQTERLAITPVWNHREDPPQMTGYRVDNALRVIVRDATTAGELIDAAVNAGEDAVRIDGLAFSIEDDARLVAAARAAAWHDAASKAAHLAELAGVALGAAVSITESPLPTPAPMLRAAALEAATPVAAGEHTLTVRLTVSFSIAT